MKIGKFEVHSISDGFFRLDGGAMFGVVPRVLWEKTNPPDNKNRVRLSLSPLLIITDTKKILVDTGIGDKGDEKFREMFVVERNPTLIESLARVDITPEDIDVVVNTHLHWDHVGGNTLRTEDGKIVPAFPNARYIVQKGEWEDAVDANERTKGSYHEDDFVPLEGTGQLDLIDGNHEIEEGIELIKIPGHNRHFQTVFLNSEGEKAVYLGDLIPTATHISYPYIMGFDLFPLETLEAKKRLLSMAAKEHRLLFFEHDPKIKMGYVTMEDGKPVLEEVRETEGV